MKPAPGEFAVVAIANDGTEIAVTFSARSEPEVVVAAIHNLRDALAHANGEMTEAERIVVKTKELLGL